MAAQVIRKPEQLDRFAVRGISRGRLLQIFDRLGEIAFLVVGRAHFERQTFGGGIAGFDGLQFRDGLVDFALLHQLSGLGKLRGGRLRGWGRSHGWCRLLGEICWAYCQKACGAAGEPKNEESCFHIKD